MPLISAFLEELLRPSTLPPGPLHAAYQRGVIGIGHLVLGAFFAGLFWAPVAGWVDALTRLGGAVLYWLVKEAGDLRRGGTFWDGIEDAALVGLGLFYAGQWWAPGAALVLGGYLMMIGARRAK
jgi:hypothetical protein